MALIDSWDGETFYIAADGYTVYSKTWNFASSTSNTCQTANMNDAYVTTTFGFNHTASTLTFVFSSTLDQTADDEAWGICDFTVKASLVPVLANGNTA